MKVVRKASAMQRRADALRGAGHRIGLVPTMGALHAGHLSLVHAARRECDVVIATIFVNPTQFGPREDLARYPRSRHGDYARLRAAACDVAFVPPPEEIYSRGFDTWVVPGDLAARLEGTHRPHHFRGVATVCLKLFGLCKPHRAYFGQKDFQQLQVIRRMVRDLDVDLRIRERPIVRDVDGLALSSRNRYLTPRQRALAPVLYETLRAGADALRGGVRPQRAAARGRRALMGVPGIRLDYFEICAAETLRTARPGDTDLVLLGAIRLGSTRLIDNVRVRLKSPR